MTLQQLKYIVAVDDFRHFGKAAEACGLTQPTLSLMIKKLEEELDIRIFDRDAHPVTATEIGRKIIDRAKMVLYNADQICEMTRSEKEMLSGPLKIGLISTVSPVLVPGLYKYITSDYPSISLRIEEMLTQTVLDKLRKAEIDMGIISGPLNDPDFLEIPLYAESFFAYVSPGHPAFLQESICAEDLFSQPVWIIKDGLRQISPEEFRNEEEKSYERFFEGGRVGILIQVVNDNGGLTVIPETHAGLILFSQQACLKPIVDPEIKRTISLVVRNDYIHESMLNVVVDAIKKIIPAKLWERVIRQDHLKI